MAPASETPLAPDQEEKAATAYLETPPTPTPAADLGPKQWLQILSTFVVFFNTWGILLTFGVFQTYYEQVLIRNKSSSDIAWISTAGAFVVLSAGIVTGPLYDHAYYRVLLLSGSLLQVFGMMMISISKEYYQLFITQAICVGLGAGIAFTPSVAAAAACLTNPATRAKAMGLMACGSSIGGVVYPLMFRSIVRSVGFGWAVRSIAFVMLSLYVVSYLPLLNHQEPPPVIRRFFDTSALRDAPFMVLCIGSIFSATAYYIPFLYLPLLTKVRIPSVGSDLAFDLLAILNGSSAVGRLLAGVAAAIFGPTETTSVSLVFGSILLFCWSVVDSVAGTIVWAVFWGMVSGVLVALPGAFIPLFCPSLAVIGTRSGMYWVFI
ncbi:MFS general substrate transporter [Lindgomyces ingoldianus]|uniref:MFS general substrate transporter n=1 Tax=Lindgomyces ingoldianus TaxID=673940 RepID=A0ACB6QZI7_9PLEO|nr:MFS general substrate transporter [Lindgomyces ingoldianus]KAF2471485.1 MFS general substrate transporter [Lindgomyces ingoldianus]